MTMGSSVTWSLIISLATTLTVHAVYRTGEIQLNLQLDDKIIELDWQVSNIDHIYGYSVTVTDDDGETIYTSPLLHKSVNSMVIYDAIETGKATVCIAVLLNETKVITEACDELEVNDTQMVVGILAGVVFLVPCIIAMIYIIYKDTNVTKQVVHDQSETEILIEPVPDVNPSTSVEQMTAAAKYVKGSDNLVYDNELKEVSRHSDTVCNIVTTDMSQTKHMCDVQVELNVEQTKTPTSHMTYSGADRTVQNVAQDTDLLDYQTGDKTEIYVIRL